MKKQRILVVSSANIDFVQRMRRMPYSGETVCEPELGYSYVPGGKGANRAVAFARMGADCVFQCKLGRDSNAKRLISFYQREGIDTRYIKEDENSATGLASILVEDNGKNRIIVYPGANMTMTADDVEDGFTCYPDAVYLQFEIPDEAAIEATTKRAFPYSSTQVRQGSISRSHDSARLRFSPPTKAKQGYSPESLPRRRKTRSEPP